MTQTRHQHSGIQFVKHNRELDGRVGDTVTKYIYLYLLCIECFERIKLYSYQKHHI